MMFSPSDDIGPHCAICFDLEERISNRIAASWSKYIVTENDLSSPQEHLTSRFPSPTALTDPAVYTRTVWLAKKFGDNWSHTVDYGQKWALFDYVRDYRFKDLVYFHFTEGEEASASVAMGWHSHVSFSSKTLLKCRLFGLEQVRWCDYVLLAGMFKWFYKLSTVITKQELVTLVKFTELPFPLEHVTAHMDRKQPSQALVLKMIALTLYVLGTAVFPEELVVSARNARLHKTALWRAILACPVPSTIWFDRANQGTVLIHESWLCINGISGWEYSGWKVSE
jgi:hypothetical protein